MRTPPEILIVDDNPVNVDILQTRLQANGYQTLTASDGEQALAVARSRQPEREAFRRTAMSRKRLPVDSSRLAP